MTLQAGEKSQHNGGREVFDGELRDPATTVVRGEAQKQFERIAIGRRRVRTHVALRRQWRRKKSVTSVDSSGGLTIALRQ